MRERARGWTLLEILIVILIISLLVALLIPVVSSARRAAKKTVCASQLRQLHLAWSLYLGDYSGSSGDLATWAPRADNLASYVKNRSVWICPLDPAEEGIFQEDMQYPTSYFYLKRTIAEDVLKVDSNPGLFACMLHENCKNPYISGSPEGIICWGRRALLRVHLDGSVHPASYYPICRYDSKGERVGFGEAFWLLFTNQFCLPSFHSDFCTNWRPCREEDVRQRAGDG